MLKKLLLAVLVAAPMLVSAQTVKLGAVNPTEIMNVMPEMATAQNTLKTASDKYTAQGKTLQEEYQKKLTEYDNLTKSKAAEATLEARAMPMSCLMCAISLLKAQSEYSCIPNSIAPLASLISASQTMWMARASSIHKTRLTMLHLYCLRFYVTHREMMGKTLLKMMLTSMS